MPLYEVLHNRQVTISELAESDSDMESLNGFHMERYETNRQSGPSTRVHGRDVLAPSTEEAILREIDGISDPPVRTPRSLAMRKRLGLE